jgi:protein involved in sex pheromone biosynthesis
MKRLALLLVCSTLFIGCGNNDGRSEDPTSTNSSTTAPTSTEIQYKNYVKPDYGQTVLQQYLHLKDALVSSNVQEARDAAKLMYMHLDVSNHESIVKPLAEIIDSEDLTFQRERFYTLSQALQIALETNDDEVINAGREPLFLQYCPMAFGNQGGTWLSAERNVMNPFYGDEMLTCGVVRDSL